MAFTSLQYITYIVVLQGPVAQRITRLTTDQKIAGSNPAWVALFS